MAGGAGQKKPLKSRLSWQTSSRRFKPAGGLITPMEVGRSAIILNRLSLIRLPQPIRDLGRPLLVPILNRLKDKWVV